MDSLAWGCGFTFHTRVVECHKLHALSTFSSRASHLLLVIIVRPQHPIRPLLAGASPSLSSATASLSAEILQCGLLCQVIGIHAGSFHCADDPASLLDHLHGSSRQDDQWSALAQVLHAMLQQRHRTSTGGLQ